MKITVLEKETHDIVGIFTDELVANRLFNNDKYQFIFEPVTTEEIQLNNEQKRKQAQLKGIEFNGVMCSATAEDQNGLSALLLKHALAKMAGQQLSDIHFRFENGNVLTLNSTNIEALDAVWTPFRLSFFPPAEVRDDPALAP